MSLLVIGVIVCIILLVLTLFSAFVYSGLFEKVTVGSGAPPIGKCKIAYKYRKGSYKQCGDLFTETSTAYPGHPELRCIGIYYDDPEKTLPEDCRYAVGAVLCEGDVEPEEAAVKAFEGQGFKVFTLPAIDYAVRTTFPYRTSLSILIAVGRVYSAMAHYIKNDHKLSAHPFLEVYTDDTIHFFAPLQKQTDFYVPEADDGETADTREDSADESEGEEEGRERRSRSVSREMAPAEEGEEGGVVEEEEEEDSTSSFEMMDQPTAGDEDAGDKADKDAAEQ